MSPKDPHASKELWSGTRRFAHRFWGWYERHYLMNLSISAGLFALQLVHLYWLTTDIVAFRLLGQSLFDPPLFWEYAIILVDYTEIPTLISTTVLYLYELRRKFSWGPLLLLLFINSQWLHLFWITDEFVINQFSAQPSTVLPVWLAWVAIGIDYLELPVIVDTIRRFCRHFDPQAFVKEMRYRFWHF